jgi:NAD(P)-dependent dehydrogenase (short-subunit alcohol dehydrogenase family)
MPEQTRASPASDNLIPKLNKLIHNVHVGNIRVGNIQMMNSPSSLDGMTALVTGGASGIGEATCRAFHAAGASLIIADTDRGRADQLASELSRCEVLALDITDEAQVRDSLAATPKLDILVNNAGIGLVGNVEETRLEDLQKLFRVNVEGLFLVTKYSMPLLKAARPGPGKIVNIGSVAGLIGVKRRFAYCATKGAVVALTRQLAVDYPAEIRANCICPGTVETPFVEGYLRKFHAGEEEQTRAELHKRQPVGRMGKPEEIASLALFLASHEANFMQGSVVNIDGGWTSA